MPTIATLSSIKNEQLARIYAGRKLGDRPTLYMTQVFVDDMAQKNFTALYGAKIKEIMQLEVAELTESYQPTKYFHKDAKLRLSKDTDLPKAINLDYHRQLIKPMLEHLMETLFKIMRLISLDSGGIEEYMWLDLICEALKALIQGKETFHLKDRIKFFSEIIPSGVAFNAFNLIVFMLTNPILTQKSTPRTFLFKPIRPTTNAQVQEEQPKEINLAVNQHEMKQKQLEIIKPEQLKIDINSSLSDPGKPERAKEIQQLSKESIQAFIYLISVVKFADSLNISADLATANSDSDNIPSSVPVDLGTTIVGSSNLEDEDEELDEDDLEMLNRAIKMSLIKKQKSEITPDSADSSVSSVTSASSSSSSRGSTSSSASSASTSSAKDPDPEFEFTDIPYGDLKTSQKHFISDIKRATKLSLDPDHDKKYKQPFSAEGLPASFGQPTIESSSPSSPSSEQTLITQTKSNQPLKDAQMSTSTKTLNPHALAINFNILFSTGKSQQPQTSSAVTDDNLTFTKSS